MQQRGHDNSSSHNDEQKQQLIKYGLVAGGTLLSGYLLYKLLIRSRRTKTVVSAPGKVLITGGYLVLESEYSGLVLASSSRFYSHIETVTGKSQTKSFPITLHSPQFHHKAQFTLHRTSSPLTALSTGRIVDDVIRIERASNATENKYIEFSLLYAIAVAQYFGSSKLAQTESLNVKVVADNDFYSQRQNLEDMGKKVCLKSLRELPAFYAPAEKKEINKTGLGSSAAMVTSLVAAVLVHFDVVDIKSNHGKEMVHRVAQFVHCLAQGKIGSGFDVSSATFGSQKYTRFASAILQQCLETAETKNQDLVHSFICDQDLMNILARDLELDTLKLSGSGTKWDNRHTDFQLPPGFSLFVADVHQGSNTPSMVRQVLQWKKEKREEAVEVWNQIDSLNNSVEQLFNELTAYSKQDLKTYMHTLHSLNTMPSNSWTSQFDDKDSLSFKIADCMSRLRYNFGYIRQKLKHMGNESGVPIEPDEQTKLLDATMDINGCLISGVPGAGGFDAIFCILFGNEQQTQSRVEQLWINYQSAQVCPLLLGESSSKGIVIV